MIYKLRHIFFLFLTVMFFSCSDDLPWDNKDSEVSGSELPVEFDINLVPFTGTRGVANPKTTFSTGDVIHVEAVFYDEEGHIISFTDNNGKEFESVYKAYELNVEGKWKVIGNQVIAWPADAKSGEFKAYYMSNLKDVLVSGAERKEQRLSEVDDQTDPLRSSTGRILWGHRVNLTFEHICTHLTFTGLDPDITDYFWLINKKDDITLNNVFTLRYTTDGNLKEEFISKGDGDYNDLVYVQHASSNVFDNNVKTGSEVSFFLAPGDYSNIELRTINNYSYLAYQNESTSDLHANTPYVVNIKQSKGVTFVEDDENWDDSETEVTILDPEEFLKHIVEGKEYEVDDETNQKRKVLQQTTSGTLLRCNIIFDPNKKYTPKTVPTGRYFDGGNHYISGITKNLFTTNYGTIRHLGLKNIECEEELWFENAQSVNHDNWGVLCETNQGIVDNIKIEDATIRIKLGAGSENSGTRFHVGALVGNNSGTASDIEYGTITITTTNPGSDKISSITNLGGIIGQNTNLVKDINPKDDNNSITIRPTLQGELQGLYVGGAVGQSSGNIQSVSLPNVTIDLSGSTGSISSVGGIVGRLRATIGTPSELSSCTVKGSIVGMPVAHYGTIKAFSYTGGIAGYNYNYSVKNCRAICEVTVSTTVELNPNVSYATGGGFGRIISGDNVISGNYILGTDLSGPVSEDDTLIAYVGNFAGIVPASYDWDYYSGLGNIVRDMGANNVGASIDDEIPVD